MHEVVFSNGSTLPIADYKAEEIKLRQKQGMISIRQKQWLKNVKEINKIRNIDPHTLAVTKDMTCECYKCERAKL